MHAIIPVVLLGCTLVGPAQAAEPDRVPPPPPQETRPLATRTAKERMGDKASDEQRVNDCKVPAERRSRERSANCPGEAGN